MFEPHRHFKTCILCGRYDLTKEHIFGKAFAKHLGVAKHWEAVDKGSGQAIKGPSPITHVAPKLLCSVCNSLRLSGSMDAALPHLVALSTSAPFADTDQARNDLRRYFERVAIIMDACTSNEQIGERGKQSREYKINLEHRQEPALVPMESRSAWLAGALLPRFRALVGHHPGALGVNPEMNVARFAELNAGTMSRIKRCTFVVGHLAVCLDITTGEHLPKPEAPLIALEQVSVWPLATPTTYDDYFSLYVQDEAMYWFRRLQIADPAYIAQFEAEAWGGAVPAS